MVNCYEVPAVGSVTSDYGNKLRWVCKNINRLEINNNSHNEDLMHNGPGCSDIKESQNEINGETTVQHNLKNSRLTRLQANIKADLNIYAILSIIDGKLSNEYPSKLINLEASSQREVKPISFKETAGFVQDEHRIYIIGDSHIKGLPDKVRNGLDEAFRVTGITKPKADIEGITSTLHFSSDNLTKNYLIIFYGGTKAISKNESISGFRSLKAFVQRTANTNVMLLGVPHRNDLPSFSCVNTEVELFNKRLALGLFSTM
jgi:hypothetical protein